MIYKVYYSKNLRDDHFRAIEGQITHGEVFGGGYAFIREVDAQNPEAVFAFMQGEVWSPNGEAFELISKSGTYHTSMSVGDACVDPYGNVFICQSIGFYKASKVSRIYSHVWDSGGRAEGFIRAKINGEWVEYTHRHDNRNAEMPTSLPIYSRIKYLGYLDEDTPFDYSRHFPLDVEVGNGDDAAMDDPEGWERGDYEDVPC